MTILQRVKVLEDTVLGAGGAGTLADRIAAVEVELGLATAEVLAVAVAVPARGAADADAERAKAELAAEREAASKRIAALEAKAEADAKALAKAKADAERAAKAEAEARREAEAEAAKAAAGKFKADPELAAKAIADFQAAEKASAAKARGPLPGGYAVGEKVFYAGGSETFEHAGSVYKTTLGQAGEVKGAASDPNFTGKGLLVMFPGNKGDVQCLLTQLSRAPPPPLPGGYAVGETVYFTGESETFPSGNKLTHGQEGEVMGHPESDQPHFGEGVAVMFPGNKGSTGCPLTVLSRSKP